MTKRTTRTKHKDESEQQKRQAALDFLKLKERSLFYGDNRKSYQSLSIILAIIFCFSFFEFLSVYEKQHKIKIGDLASLLGMLLFSYQFYIIQKVPPFDDQKRYNWLWTNGVKVQWLALSGTICLFLSLLFSEKYISQEIPFINKFSLIAIAFCSIITFGIVIYISYNLSQFTNKRITNISSLCVIVTFPLLVSLFYISIEVSFFKNLIWFLFFTYSVLYSIRLYKVNFEIGQFDLTQKVILKFLKPYHIVEALPTDIKNTIKNEKKALNIMEKLSKNDEYEIELYLLQKLQSKYDTKKKSSIFIFILVAIISALIEFLTQDELYNPYLKDIIQKIKNLFY